MFAKPEIVRDDAQRVAAMGAARNRAVRIKRRWG